MHYIPENLKFLRKKKGWTQDQFARHLGVKRSLIGAYEEGRADPRISFLLLVCQKFELSMDSLVGQSLNPSLSKSKLYAGTNLRILPISVDRAENTERATLVPVRAAAGYLNGYGDIEFIEKLPSFSLPYSELDQNKTYRIFQIKGDSMLPVLPGSYVICSYVRDWNDVKNDRCYVVVSKTEGIVYKRLLNNLNEGNFRLKSDNPAFEPFDISAEDILELWKAEGVTSFNLPTEHAGYGKLEEDLNSIKEELSALRKHIQTND